MKLTCEIRRAETLFPERQERLVVSYTVHSYRIESPLREMIDIPAGECERDYEKEGVPLGSPIVFEQDLPPIYLVEPCDDPEDAESWYAAFGGFRYIGQLLIPGTGWGERVEVLITREALALWHRLCASHPLQKEAESLCRETQRKQLAQDSPQYGTPDAQAKEQWSEVITQASSLLSQHDVYCQRQGLGLLAPLVLSAPACLPQPLLFGCLYSPDDLVQRTAFMLLQHVPAEHLPLDLLSDWCSYAGYSVRMAAIKLLGAIGGNKAFSSLMSVELLGDSRRERASERTATLESLASCVQRGLEHEVDYLDVRDLMQEVLDTDPHPRVCAVARDFLATLPFPVAKESSGVLEEGGRLGSSQETKERTVSTNLSL